MRGLVLAAIVALTGVGGWALLRVDWTPPSPTVVCDAVFDGPLTLTVPPGGRDAFRVEGELLLDRPEVVVQHQIVDANGFGWVSRRLAADGATAYRVDLPRVPRTHTIRVGVLGPEEAARADVVARAARRFDLRGWWDARGWLTPALDPCQTLAVPPS